MYPIIIATKSSCFSINKSKSQNCKFFSLINANKYIHCQNNEFTDNCKLIQVSPTVEKFKTYEYLIILLYNFF